MREGEGALLLIHLHVIQQGQQVDHAVTEQHLETRFSFFLSLGYFILDYSSI